MENPAPVRTGVTTSSSVLSALRKRRGRVTVGDVVAETGLGRDQVEMSLKELLEGRRGHLEVGETGTLVYRFDPRLISRENDPFLARLGRAMGTFLSQAFKVWIVLMLVVYFVVFVVLLIGALLAAEGRGGGRMRRRGGRIRIPSFWFWYFFWTPRWRWGRPYYGHRWERRYGRDGDKPTVPFIKKVFAFVFGPDRPRPSQAQRDRSIVRLVRARRGVLTAAELVQHTGLPLAEAEEEMARLMATYDGDVKVSDDGVLTYVFPELMVSAEGRVTEAEPDPAWRRLQAKESVTGNTTASNLLIGGINGFNLVAAATAPFFIFPRLGIGGPLAWVGLVWVPVVFSALFFGIPLLRSLAVRIRNRTRGQTNVRKVLLGQAFDASLSRDGTRALTVGGALERVRAVLGARRSPGTRRTSSDAEPDPAMPASELDAALVERNLQDFLAEFGGDVVEEADGTVAYRFPEIRTQLAAAEDTRTRLALESQTVGEIVYASDETEEESQEREARAFDRELERGRNLERYLQNPERVAVLDDFELVAFEEEMAERKAQRDRGGRERSANPWN